MDHEHLWQHIHAERASLAANLAGLDDDQWAHDTLCPGWTVKDVAAHVISTPQIGWRQMPAMAARNFGRGYNTMIYREVKRLGARETPESILADFERFAGERVRLEMMQPVEGRKRFSGRLLGVGASDITLELENGRISLPIDDIHRARLAPDM